MESEPARLVSSEGTTHAATVFQMVVQHSVDGVIIGDPGGSILYANRAACEMFRATEEELRRVGRAGIADTRHPVWKLMLETRRRTRQMTGVAPMVRLDGTTFVAEIASAIFDIPDGERTCVTLRDVTVRVREERNLAAYNEVVHALLAGAEVQVVLELVARHARIIFDATDATVVTPSPPPDDVVVAAADGPVAAELLGHGYPPGTLARRVMDRREPVLIPDMRTADGGEEGHLLGSGSAMVAPIYADDDVYGVLFVGVAARPLPYQGEDLELVADFARRAALAIAVGEARTASERQQRQLNSQLQEALRSRVIIEQAKGVISATRRITPEEGFQRLRAYARSHNQDVHSTAQSVVEGKLLI